MEIPLLPTDSHTAQSYLGRYEHQIDTKGRLSLPRSFRRDGDRFVMLQWESPYLTLFPPRVWRQIEGRLQELRRADPEGSSTVRRIVSNAVEVDVDKVGRLLIPSWLRDSAGLVSAVLVIGNIDRVELWDPASYNRHNRSTEGLGAHGMEFAARIFG